MTAFDVMDGARSRRRNTKRFRLDDAVLTRFLAPKPNYNAERTVFTYTGELSNVLLSSAGNAPGLLNRSYTITAEVEVPAGGAEGMLVTDGLEFDWKYDGPGMGKGGTGTLKADGTVLDNHPMQRSLPISIMWCEGFNVGLDTGTPVDDQDYQVPFRFTGKINKLRIKLGPTQLTSNDRQVIQHALATRD